VPKNMVFCDNCGNEFDDILDFCPICGWERDDSNDWDDQSWDAHEEAW
jgi:rRNA maturation endonuclease Nob1